MHSFEVHSNFSACRKVDVLGCNKSFIHGQTGDIYYLPIPLWTSLCICPRYQSCVLLEDYLPHKLYNNMIDQ